MNVYVIESGEYDEKGVDGIAISPGAALDFLKKEYGKYYDVEWSEIKQIGTAPEKWVVTAVFKRVPPYLGPVTEFTFTKWKVEDYGNNYELLR